MIIEIKDLPNGRSVKKITFDIEFEDGIPSKDTIELDTTGPELPIVPKCDSTPVTHERQYIPIPDEMTNQEY